MLKALLVFVVLSCFFAVPSKVEAWPGQMCWRHEDCSGFNQGEVCKKSVTDPVGRCI
jgi:hypothetical protein